jgi:hypothetical protein
LKNFTVPIVIVVPFQETDLAVSEIADGGRASSRQLKGSRRIAGTGTQFPNLKPNRRYPSKFYESKMEITAIAVKVILNTASRRNLGLAPDTSRRSSTEFLLERADPARDGGRASKVFDAVVATGRMIGAHQCALVCRIFLVEVQSRSPDGVEKSWSPP